MSKKKPRTPVDALPTGMENADPLYTQEQGVKMADHVKTYTLVVRWKDCKGRNQTTFLTGLTQEEGTKLYDYDTSLSSLVWAKLINDHTGMVWKEIAA